MIMAKFFFTNWRTFLFSQPSYDKQLDRFAVACVVSIVNPNRVLDTVPIYASSSFENGPIRIIKLIHNIEQGIPLDNESKRLWKLLQQPIDGGFRVVKAKVEPLFHIYTSDEGKYGLCDPEDVGKPERDESGEVKIYNTIRVFTKYIMDSEKGTFIYERGWSPDEMYYKKIDYQYFPISQLDKYL